MDARTSPDSTTPDAIVHLRARVAGLEAALVAAKQSSEAMLGALFAQAPIGLAFLDTELRFVRINTRLAKINGPSPEEHIGRTIEEVLPDLASQLLTYCRQVLATGEAVLDTEIHGVTPDAPEHLRDWLCSYYPVPGTDGQIIGVGVVVAEITERKQAEAELTRQAAILREQAELLDLAHVILRNPDGRITFWNQGAEKLYGWTHDEAVGRIAHDLFQTRFPVSIEAVQEALLARGEWEGELVHRCKDGSEIVVASHQVLSRDAAGRPLHIVEVNNDITARRQAEDELRYLAERLQTLNMIDRAILAAQTPEQIAGVIVPRLRQLVPCEHIVVSAYDPEHQRIQRLAQSAMPPGFEDPAQLLPIEPHDLLPPFALGEHWYVPDIDQVEVLAPRGGSHGALGIRALLHFPLVAGGQLLGMLRLGATRPAAFSTDQIAIVSEIANQLAIALHGANLRAQVEQERALLARRVAERTADLSAANAELAQAARVKDEFLSNMSHELRTPLNAILGRTELLHEQLYGPLTPQQDSAIQSIAEAGQHLLGLINDILDLSKVEAGKLSLELVPLEVEAVGRAAVRMVSEMAISRKVALTATYDARIETVVADERRLKQILVNLLSNAVKFTPEGGKVGLDVQADPEGQVVTFTVWDTGIGIAAEDQARLFQPFVQIDSSLNREHEGTGLGLTLVLRLTELHGGSIALESVPGQGSRFSVALPWVAHKTTAAVGTGARPEPAPTPPAIRQTLVIEDSHTAVEQISRYLSDLGSRVEVYNRASGAVERARTLQPDLIVLDILLPDQPGWEVLRQLKADPRTAAIPVLVTSVVDEPARAYALGAAGFVLKPLTRDLFLGAIRQLHTLPESAGQPTDPLTLIVAPQGGAARPVVLLVDDNEANLALLVDYLPTLGYAVVVARNGAEAVAQAEELSPALIVMDIQMPVLDGLEATRRIRAAGLRDTPILVLTALAMAGDRERCLEAGADAYLAKPVSLRALANLIAAQLQRPQAGLPAS